MFRQIRNKKKAVESSNGPDLKLLKVQNKW